MIRPDFDLFQNLKELLHGQQFKSSEPMYWKLNSIRQLNVKKNYQSVGQLSQVVKGTALKDFSISCGMKQRMFKLKNAVHYFLGNIHIIQVLYTHKWLTMNNALKDFDRKKTHN